MRDSRGFTYPFPHPASRIPHPCSSLISPAKTFRQLRKTIFSRHAANSAWNVADVAVYPLVMVFSMRTFMAQLGEQQFGIWMWVNTIIASLSLVNIGFGDATVKFVAEYRSKHQLDKAAAVINTTLSVYAAMAVGLAIVCYAGAEVVEHFNFHRYFKIEDKNKEISLLAFEIGSVTFCLRLVEQIILSALKGLERYDASARLSILSKSVVLGLNIYMVLHGYSLVQIFINGAIVTAMGLLIQFYWLKRLVPELSLRPHFRSPLLKQVGGYGLWAWLGSVLGVLGSQIDKYLVTALAGVSIFGYYSAAATMADRGLSVAAAGAGFLFPIISARFAKQDPLLKMYYKVQTVMVAAGLLAGTAAILLQAPVFSFILKDKYPPTAVFLHPFLIYFGVMTCTVVPYYFLVGSGIVRYGTVMRLITLFFQAILVPAAFYVGGAPLMPIGLLTAYFLASFFHSGILAKQVYQTEPVRFALEQGLLPGLFIACMVANQPWSPWVFLAVGGLVWKLVFFDKVSFVFRK